MKPISRIDPKQGKLYFRGHNATELAKNCIYEDVLFLLVYGHLPEESESLKFRGRLKEIRRLVEVDIPLLVERIDKTSSATTQRATDGYDRTEMLGLRVLAKNLDNYAKKFNLDREDTLLLFVTMAPLVLASGWRQVQKKKLILPKEILGHSHEFHWMARGTELPPEDARDLETCFILHMDDPDNPSLATLEKCIGEGQSLSETLVATLDKHVDPLHHGAGELSMQTMIDIGHSKEIEPYLTAKILKGELIYGLGHRIYRTFDPRARVLKEILERRTKEKASYALTNRIEGVARIGAELILKQKGKVVYPNVDLYNSAVYLTFGFPYFINTELFAVSRSAGWAAHIMELSQ